MIKNITIVLHNFPQALVLRHLLNTHVPVCSHLSPSRDIIVFYKKSIGVIISGRHIDSKATVSVSPSLLSL